MRLFDFECPKCGRVREELLDNDEHVICFCGFTMRRLPSRFSIVLPGNIGPKLRTRVALDDELKLQGFSTPLYSSELAKDQVRWTLKKEGIK